MTYQSPSQVPGAQSGELREVDVWVEVQSEDGMFLIMIECRDRSRPQGLEWLDQVAGKLADIGAHRAILVSSHGFTRSASRYAAAKGLELRSVNDVLADDFDWFTSSARPVFEWRLSEVTVTSTDGRTMILLAHDRHVDLTADCLIETQSGEIAPYRDLIDHRALFRLGRSRPNSASDVLEMSAPPGQSVPTLAAFTPFGRVPVAGMRITLVSHPVPRVTKALSYTGEDGPLIERIEMPLPWPVPQASLVASLSVDSGTFAFGFRRDPDVPRRSGFRWILENELPGS